MKIIRIFCFKKIFKQFCTPIIEQKSFPSQHFLKQAFIHPAFTSIKPRALSLAR